jgi:hypothetical protein
MSTNPPLPEIGTPVWGMELNTVLSDLRSRATVLEGGTGSGTQPGAGRIICRSSHRTPHHEPRHGQRCIEEYVLGLVTAHVRDSRRGRI